MKCLVERVSSLLIAVMICGLFPDPASAVDDVAMQAGISRLVDAVMKAVDEVGGEKAILVGDFVGTPRLRGAGSAGVAQLITSELRTRGVRVEGKAPFQLLGRISADSEEKQNEKDTFSSVALRINADLLDQSDTEVAKFTIPIFGDAPLQFTGGTGVLPSPENPGLPDAAREAAKAKAIDEPSAVLVGDAVHAAADSPFGVTILVDGQPRLPTIESGQAFVDLSDGEEYVVRLVNNASHETAVTLSIDGLSMFAFSEAGNFGSQVVVGPDATVDIRGWFITPRKTDLFEIGRYSESAAASKRLPSTSVGVVTASFCESVVANDKDPKATLRGKQVDQSYVNVPRIVKKPIAVVSVRYDR